MAWNFDAAFEFGLNLILDGVAAEIERNERRTRLS
jgi:hypothetical protein